MATMDSPIDPVNKGTEYVGLPKVDPWHESEKHKKKRFAKMLEDRMDDQKEKRDSEDAVELSGQSKDESENETPETARPQATDQHGAEAPTPTTHIDVKG